jgi:hypothetical protein
MHGFALFLVILAAVAVVGHLAGGARAHRRHYREHGVHPNLYYTYGRGWYGSVRVGGFRIGHRL